MLFGDFSKYDNTVAYRNLVLSLVPPNIALYEYVKAFPEVPPGFIRDMECYISKHTCIEKFEHINRRISKVAN